MILIFLVHAVQNARGHLRRVVVGTKEEFHERRNGVARRYTGPRNERIGPGLLDHCAYGVERHVLVSHALKARKQLQHLFATVTKQVEEFRNDARHCDTLPQSQDFVFGRVATLFDECKQRVHASDLDMSGFVAKPQKI